MPFQTGLILERATPRIATSGALTSGVKAVPPMPCPASSLMSRAAGASGPAAAIAAALVALFVWAVPHKAVTLGQSLATKLAPAAFNSQMVALFFLSVAIGSSASGWLAGFYDPEVFRRGREVTVVGTVEDVHFRVTAPADLARDILRRWLDDPRLIQHSGSAEQLAAYGLRPAA